MIKPHGNSTDTDTRVKPIPSQRKPKQYTLVVTKDNRIERKGGVHAL